MFQTGSAFPTLHVCLYAILVLVGLWVLLSRSRRRVGDEPRCRRCEYILVGELCGRCPECGAEVEPGRVVYGARKRRGKVMAAGVALVFTDRRHFRH